MKLKTIHKSLIIIFIVFIVFILMMMSRLSRYISIYLLDTNRFNSRTKYKNITKIKNMTPIYLFIHLCNYGDNWKTIISSQIKQIINSGLYDKCEHIFYGCSCDNCEEEFNIFLKNYKKITKLPSQPNYVNENMTINCVLEFSVNLLNNNYNTVGVNYRKFSNLPHYAGNFWWGRSEYIKKLDYIDESNFNNRYLAEYKILDKKEKNKHINLSNEFWFSQYGLGLYSPIDYDHSLDYAEHKYYHENPGELDIYIF